MNTNYVAFIKELKESIIQSRYIANRLANKEQLLLNYRTDKNISEKIAMEKWGAKILNKISEDLQVQLPGLKGFSASNLKKMRIFADAYSSILQIGSTASNQLNSGGFAGTLAISSTLSNQIGTERITEAFYGVSFSHHFTTLDSKALYSAGELEGGRR